MRLIISLIFSVLLLSCSSTKKNSIVDPPPTPPKSPERIQSDAPKYIVRGIIVDETLFNQESAEYAVKQISIEGDSIYIDVSFGGGCESHEFTLVSPGYYAESMPPQLTLSLVHDANDDVCKALFHQRLAFDLTPARFNASGTIMIRIKDQKGMYAYTY